MDLKRTSPGQDVYVSVTSALVSALLEWMLMFMIFLDAAFSYLVTSFACYFQLPIPCLLCSRLDCERFRHLICHKHKLKISSLVHGTCDNCFSSFSMISKSNVEPRHNDEHSIAQKLFRSKSNINSELGQMKNKDHHLLPHVEYTKMKVTSESESEMETQVLTSTDFPALEKLLPPSDFQSHDSVGSHPTVESQVPLPRELEELNKQQADCNNEPSQLLSFSEATPSPDTLGTQQTYATNAASESKTEVHVECGECSNLDSDPSVTRELRNHVNMECAETSAVGEESSPENEIQVESKAKTCSQIPEPLDLGEAYKFAVSSRGRQLSGKFLEQQKSMADSRRASEDVKLLLSQLSFARGIDSSLLEISPRVSESAEDFRAMDTSSGMQIMQRRISLERNESSLSIDGSGISEIEGESVVDRLRRQVEHDKKIKCSLYKELEEEINASATAANQAMAMITRLQEEKASLHMEALQYLRMMEEQSAYDSESLDNANNLLAEKEKQIQDLEYELQLYRNQFGDVSSSNTFDKPKPESKITDKLDANCGGSINSSNDKHGIVKKSSLELFEDEKQHLLQCLRKLENKLFIFANPDMINGENKLVMEASASGKLDWMGDSEGNGGTEKNHPLNETPSQHGNKLLFGQNDRDTELETFRQDLFAMNNRLEALEAEQNVIECSVNSLEKGSEGLEFIREIVARLQEMHSDYIGTRDDNFGFTPQ